MTSIEGKNVPNKDVIVVKHQKGEVIRLGPVRMDILEDGSNTDQRLGAANITIPPKTAGPPQHWHQMHDETFLILSGTVTFTSRDQQVVLTTGDYIVVPPMALHTFANDSDEVAVMYSTFTPGYYVKYFRVMEKTIKDNGRKMTGEIATEVMSRYAILTTKAMGEPY